MVYKTKKIKNKEIYHRYKNIKENKDLIKFKKFYNFAILNIKKRRVKYILNIYSKVKFFGLF